MSSIDTARSGRSIGSSVSSGRKPGNLQAIREAMSYKSQPKASYPFLEFRIVNDHANYKNRSIRNARVTAMVQLSSRDADLVRGLDNRRSSRATFREYVTVSSSAKEDSRLSSSSTSNNNNSDHSLDRPPPRLNNSNARNRRKNIGGLTQSIIATALVVQETDQDEGSAAGTPEGRVYYPLNLEPDNHPYFRRVFYFRHTLNARSPLLKHEVREKIKREGCWDSKRCTHQDILGSLIDFHRIRLTFKGTAAVSNALVFAQKVYTIEDVYIGWQFGQIFYEKERSWFRRLLIGSKKKQAEEEDDDDDDDDKMMLDKRLIHDILPQQGGGQEPIIG